MRLRITDADAKIAAAAATMLSCIDKIGDVETVPPAIYGLFAAQNCI